MKTNTRAVRLAWSDDGALERRAVELACRGSTRELKAYLELVRRRVDLDSGREVEQRKRPPV